MQALSAPALWYVAPGKAVLRDELLQPIADGRLLVRALWSGLSRGTERLVYRGQVPESEWQRMRAPFQEGAFPFPVKYGYQFVGRVDSGPEALVGRVVFALAPHQALQCLPGDSVVPLPEGLPPRRAVLGANIETALNVLWDAAALPGERILIIGGGVLGMLLARLAAQLPGAEVTVVDLRPERAETARALGAAFALPGAAPGDRDLVLHTSASPAGLRLALEAAGAGGRIVEASWYGTRDVRLPLGAGFHFKRLGLSSSQVGQLPAAMARRWTHRRRLAKALDLLQDPAFDRLLGEEIAFERLPGRLAQLLDPSAAGFLPVIRYPGR
ncbi:MAG: zinc-binding alcohol dehydrogenase [Rhodospirillales bacterium]|nr:zinc-binding alcohol dehydrogenase [Rhodospirillales bacterium]